MYKLPIQSSFSIFTHASACSSRRLQAKCSCFFNTIFFVIALFLFGGVLLRAEVSLEEGPVESILSETSALSLYEEGNEIQGPDGRNGVIHYVTAQEYCDFLNKRAQNDIFGLYNAMMGEDPVNGVIQRQGEPGNYFYAVLPGRGKDRISFIDTFKAARYCNYLENKLPSIIENPFGTENGAYLPHDEMIDGQSIVQIIQDSKRFSEDQKQTHTSFLKRIDGARYSLLPGLVKNGSLSSLAEMKQASSSSQLAIIDYGDSFQPEITNNHNELLSNLYSGEKKESEQQPENINSLEMLITPDQDLDHLMLGISRDQLLGSPQGSQQSSNSDSDSTTLDNLFSSDFNIDDFRLLDQKMEMVRVGAPDNDNDSNYMKLFNAPVGSVHYIFNIGKYLVTTDQWCEFLMSVAREGDPYQLCPPAMTGNQYIDVFSSDLLPRDKNQHLIIDEDTPIIRTKINEGAYRYSYQVRPGHEHLPITYVGYYAALRFCNWLQNGCPVGPEGPGTTETGTYKLKVQQKTVPLPFIDPLKKAGSSYFPFDYEWYLFVHHQELRPSTDNYYEYFSDFSQEQKQLTDRNNPFLKEPWSRTSDGIFYNLSYYETELDNNEIAAAQQGRTQKGWRLPSLNEWHKAAFFDPNKKPEPNKSSWTRFWEEDTSEMHYWKYPVQSDKLSEISNYLPNEKPSNTSKKAANYTIEGDFHSTTKNPPGLTPVGSFPSSHSPWGAYDMLGNAWEMLHDNFFSPKLQTQMAGCVGGSYTNTTGELFDKLYNGAATIPPEDFVGSTYNAVMPLAPMSDGDNCFPDVGFRVVYQGDQENLTFGESFKEAMALIISDIKSFPSFFSHPAKIFDFFQYIIGADIMRWIVSPAIKGVLELAKKGVAMKFPQLFAVPEQDTARMAIEDNYKQGLINIGKELQRVQPDYFSTEEQDKVALGDAEKFCNERYKLDLERVKELLKLEGDRFQEALRDIGKGEELQDLDNHGVLLDKLVSLQQETQVKITGLLQDLYDAGVQKFDNLEKIYALQKQKGVLTETGYQNKIKKLKEEKLSFQKNSLDLVQKSINSADESLFGKIEVMASNVPGSYSEKATTVSIEKYLETLKKIQQNVKNQNELHLLSDIDYDLLNSKCKQSQMYIEAYTAEFIDHTNNTLKARIFSEEKAINIEFNQDKSSLEANYDASIREAGDNHVEVDRLTNEKDSKLQLLTNRRNEKLAAVRGKFNAQEVAFDHETGKFYYGERAVTFEEGKRIYDEGVEKAQERDRMTPEEKELAKKQAAAKVDYQEALVDAKKVYEDSIAAGEEEQIARATYVRSKDKAIQEYHTKFGYDGLDFNDQDQIDNSIQEFTNEIENVNYSESKEILSKSKIAKRDINETLEESIQRLSTERFSSLESTEGEIYKDNKLILESRFREGELSQDDFIKNLWNLGEAELNKLIAYRQKLDKELLDKEIDKIKSLFFESKSLDSVEFQTELRKLNNITFSERVSLQSLVEKTYNKRDSEYSELEKKGIARASCEELKKQVEVAKKTRLEDLDRKMDELIVQEMGEVKKLCNNYYDSLSPQQNIGNMGLITNSDVPVAATDHVESDFQPSSEEFIRDNPPPPNLFVGDDGIPATEQAPLPDHPNPTIVDRINDINRRRIRDLRSLEDQEFDARYNSTYSLLLHGYTTEDDFDKLVNQAIKDRNLGKISVMEREDRQLLRSLQEQQKGFQLMAGNDVEGNDSRLFLGRLMQNCNGFADLVRGQLERKELNPSVAQRLTTEVQQVWEACANQYDKLFDNALRALRLENLTNPNEVSLNEMEAALQEERTAVITDSIDLTAESTSLTDTGVALATRGEAIGTRQLISDMLSNVITSTFSEENVAMFAVTWEVAEIVIPAAMVGYAAYAMWEAAHITDEAPELRANAERMSIGMFVYSLMDFGFSLFGSSFIPKAFKNNILTRAIRFQSQWL